MVIDLNTHSKIQNDQRAKIGGLVNLPQCYSNYNKSDLSCRQCAFQDSCKGLPSPKEPEWCNSI
ncbi:MAG: hypothetical protein JW891_12940 [Candidatus Lokiarchaeota archaeon]|nr:hypothetical protein [Candidatus Lokiarchaeota archaeon]